MNQVWTTPESEKVGWFFVVTQPDDVEEMSLGVGFNVHKANSPLPHPQPLASYIARDPYTKWHPYKGDPKPIMEAFSKAPKRPSIG